MPPSPTPTPPPPSSGRRRPLLVGLTGAIGAGKSAALAAFARHGAAILSSDAVVHDLYRTDAVRDAVVVRLGPDVLTPDGEVDRRRVAARVFGDAELMAWLEGLLHPLVAEELARWCATAGAAEPPPRLLVHEVPLLFEADLASRYDRTLVVTTSPALRQARLAGRGGLEAIAQREARLLPEADKLRRADDVLHNDGDLEALDRAVQAYVQQYAPAA